MKKTLPAFAAVAVLMVGCGSSGRASDATAAVTSEISVTTTRSSETTLAPVNSAIAATTTTTLASSIGEPADDGARIISVETNSLTGPDPCFGDPYPGQAPVTRARDITIDSPAVGLVKVQLLLPSGFETHRTTRWPVLFMLPGGIPGSSRLHRTDCAGHLSWTDWGDLETLSAPTDLLVVIPDTGSDGRDGYFSDWWNFGKAVPPMWETFHLVELPQLLERNWQAGDKRAIAGVSLGGYGAMEYAERKPGMFLFAGAYSGQFRPPPSDIASAVWGDPVAQVDVWRAHDLFANAAALMGTTLFVSYGNGQPGPLNNYKADPFGLEAGLAADGTAFVKQLDELSIPVTVYAYEPGTHTIEYFQRAFDQSFPLILAALGE